MPPMQPLAVFAFHEDSKGAHELEARELERTPPAPLHNLSVEGWLL